MEGLMRAILGAILCVASGVAGLITDTYWIVMTAIVGGVCISPAMRETLDWILIQAEKAEKADQHNRGKDQL